MPRGISRANKIYLIANSVGEFFSLISLSDKPIEKAMLFSPIVDMERLILDVMKWANISEDELIEKKKLKHPLENFCHGNI